MPLPFNKRADEVHAGVCSLTLPPDRLASYIASDTSHTILSRDSLVPDYSRFTLLVPKRIHEGCGSLFTQFRAFTE